MLDIWTTVWILACGAGVGVIWTLMYCDYKTRRREKKENAHILSHIKDLRQD